MCKSFRFAAAILFVIVSTISCSKIADDNQIQDDYWDKSYFNKNWQTKALGDDEWYYRYTVTDTPANTTAASIGEGHWLHPETLRFEITEHYLIGWRSHGSVLGADDRSETKNASPKRGAPVAIFPIEKHFDIVRARDPVTFENSNVIEENVDRPWHERKFMRVNWSVNVAAKFSRNDAGGSIVERLASGTRPAYAVLANDIRDPKRFHFDSGYFDITTRQAIPLDYLSLIGRYGEAYVSDTAAPIIDAMHSFMKKERSNYQSLHYPDSVVQVDGLKRPMLNPKGFAKLIPIGERFGFFRAGITGRQSYDDYRGALESRKNYNIARFSIWQQSYDDKGNEIAIENRIPKPIIYYTNVGHPLDLLTSSREAAAAWNNVFKHMVYVLQPHRFASQDAVPDMFVLRENDCNVANVQAFLCADEELNKLIARRSLPSIQSLVQDMDRIRNPSKLSHTQRNSMEMKVKGELERLCSAMEYLSSKEHPFRYQRAGDLRYNLVNLIAKEARTPWSGYGPMQADALTGEIIQATANVNLWYIDAMAARANDQIEAIKNDMTIDELIEGSLVGEAVEASLSLASAPLPQQPSSEALKVLDARFAQLKLSGDNDSPALQKQRLAKLAHTGFEKKLFDPMGREELLMHPTLMNDADLTLGESILEHISPARTHDVLSRMRSKDAERQVAGQTVMDPPEFLEQMVVGTALALKDMEKQQRFYAIRSSVFKAVLLHEIGHNLGLMHNMAAMKDPLNYPSEFWKVEMLPSKLEQALAATQDVAVKKKLDACLSQRNFIENYRARFAADVEMTTQDCLRQQERMYSSIMGYHATWNSDLDGLGPYDAAAIKFGYGQLLEVFPRENLKLDLEREDAKKWLFLHDWKKIPQHFVRDASKISERQHMRYVWEHNVSDNAPPSNAVPYLYCFDPSGSLGPACKAYDFGPDMRSRAQWLSTKYWQRYFMTHFARGRLWNLENDLMSPVNADLSTLNEFTNIMHWYHYYKVTMPEFSGSDAEKDYVAAVVAGLNHFSHVLSHPNYGEYVTAPNYMAEGVLTSAPENNRLALSSVMVPLSEFESCPAKIAVERVAGVPPKALGNFTLAQVPLGEGRPFFLGVTNDYDAWFLKYVGTYFTKMNATTLLGAVDVLYPQHDDFMVADPRFNTVSWYRLFPDEIGSLMSSLITNDLANIGPLFSKGKIIRRNLIDPVTLKKPDYSGMLTLRPTMSTNMPIRAMMNAVALMSNSNISELNFINMMRASVLGADDYVSSWESFGPDSMVEFVHPEHALVYQAIKAGEHPIAYNLVSKLNVLKERFVRLDKCVTDEEFRKHEKFCACVNEGDSADCGPAALERVGMGTCSMANLTRRRDDARERMNDLMNFIDDMRWLVKLFDSAL